MPSYCIVQGCQSKTYRSKNRENKRAVSFFKIPTNENTKKKWAEALLNFTKQIDPLTPSGRVCAAHFLPECFIQRGFANTRLKPNAVPSIFPKLLTEETNVDHTDNSTIEKTYPYNMSEPLKSEETSKTMIVIHNSEKSEHTINHSVSASKENTPGSPTKCKILVRYPGDIKVEKIHEMTPWMIRKTMNILRSSCERKNHIIKCLRVQATRQKRKIRSLNELLLKLKGNSLISPNAYDVLQGFLKKL